MFVLKSLFGMKSSCVRWQFSPVRDTTLEGHQMPGVTRSDRDVTFQKSGKMAATNFLRLNSVGEVSADKFPEATARKGKLGFSKSLDSVTPSKSFSAAHPVKLSAGFLGQDSGYRLRGGNNTQFSPGPNFSSSTNMFIRQPFPLQFGFQHYNRQMFPTFNFNFYPDMHDRSKFSAACNGQVKSMMNYPHSPRCPGLLPRAMFTAVSAFPDSGRKVPQTGFNCSWKGSGNQAYTSPYNSNFSGHKSKHSKSSQCAPPENVDLHVKESETTKTISLETESATKKVVNIEESVPLDIEKINTVVIKDSLPLKQEHVYAKCVDSPKACNSVNELPSPKENSLKRRNDKTEATVGATGSNVNCPLTTVISDLSSVLFLRKTPKKGRPSCKKRKKRQLQKTASVNSQPNNCHSVESIQPLCSSPNISPSIKCMPASVCASNVPHQPSPLKPRPSCSAKLFCQPDSDSEGSDIDDCDSVKLSCDFPKSLSPLNNLGSALSLDNLFKPKSLPCLDTLLNDNKRFDPEQDCKADSPAPTPGPLCFSFSISVSEDEDSDKSFESFSSSPSEQLLLDFGFSNGLSLESIIGKRAETSSNSSEDQSCADDKKPASEQAALILKINAEWNKNYPSVPCSSSLNDTGKVQFVSDEDLAEIHIVGNEDRRGTWFEDGQRFKRRINDVGKVISHVFTEDHREKICQKFGLNS